MKFVTPMSLSRRNQQMNSKRSQLGCMLIYSRIKKLIIYLLLKKLQSSFLRKVSIMHWIIEIWYYGLKEDNLNGSARIVLHILLFIMFCCFQRERMGGIQEFQSVVLNLENEGRMQGKEIGRNMLTHRWCLIHATMPIVFMSEMVFSHLSSMVESCSSSLLLMHGQIVSKGNSTGLGHISILLDLSSTRDFRILLCMIDMMEKMLGLWDTNSFFLLLI